MGGGETWMEGKRKTETEGWEREQTKGQKDGCSRSLVRKAKVRSA